MTNQRHLLVQNTSKWKGKLFCLFFFFHKKCWLAFVFEESYSFYVFFLPEALWGDEVGEWLRVGAGTLLLMFPGFGHGVSVCTQTWPCCKRVCRDKGQGLLWLSPGKWVYWGDSEAGVTPPPPATGVTPPHPDFPALLSLPRSSPASPHRW